MGVDDGILRVSGVNFASVGELLERSVAAATEYVVCFRGGKSRWTGEREVFEGSFGGFLAVEDGEPSSTLGRQKPSRVERRPTTCLLATYSLLWFSEV